MATGFNDITPTKAFQAQLENLPKSSATLVPFMANKGTHKGEEWYVTQIGSTSARKGRVRRGKHEIDDATFARRRITPEFAYKAITVDSKDAAETIINPNSDIATEIRLCLERQMFQDAVSAAFGTAYTGKAGATGELFNVAGTDVVQATVGVTSGNGSINADKITKAIRLMQDRGFNLADPRNELTLVMAPEQAASAKTDTVLASYDYMSGKILSGINIPNGFMGIKNVIVDPACPYADAATTGVNPVWDEAGLATDTAGADLRMAFLFCKSALAYVTFNEPVVRIDELQERHYDYQVYGAVHYGFSRMYAQGGVIGILCDQSP